MSQNGAATRFIYAPELTPAQDVFRGTGRRLGAYAQQSFWLASGKVRLTAGVRQDSHSVSPVAVTSPYASLSFLPRPSTRLQVDWGQYAQFPELNQFFSRFALSRLLPERATHVEVALEQRLNERLRLRLEVYDRQDRDLLASPLLDARLLVDGSVQAASPTAPLVNSERGFARGVQIFLQRRTANGFTGWISYAYGRAELHDGILQQQFAADYDQPHTLNAYVSRRLKPTINLSARFTYGSGMPLPGFYRRQDGGYMLSQDRNVLRAPAYQRTDLRLNKAFVHKRSKTTLYGEIINLTNHSNRDFDSPGPYEVTSGRVYPNFYSMFPILPSAGVLLEF